MRLSIILGLCGAVLALGFVVAPVSAQDLVEEPRPISTNDTFLSRQWYLDAIHAREAWNVATGSRDVIIAVIDSGVDVSHPDLKNNLWTNPDEVPMNGKDDDGDGFIDDVHGWNFVSDSSDVRPVEAHDGLHEAFIHGTVVASLIAAQGNDDIGISGVSWRARIMPLVVIAPDGYGRDEDIIDAIHYAVDHGADIINLSLVGYEFNTQLAQAVHEATSQGVLVVSAAGNSDDLNGQDMDQLPGYPACDKGAAGRGQLTVTALRRNNTKAAYANYGTCVDVSAPGEDLFTAKTSYEPFQSGIAAGYVGGLSGTSLAAPLVSGLAAVLKAEHPSWSGSELAARIIATSDPIDVRDSALIGKMGHGRINVWRAVQMDSEAEQYGPFVLEGSAPGFAPEVRVSAEDGAELARFAVGEKGDRRGIRASFVRWEGGSTPNVAVTTLGDPTGAWRIYRFDGVLVAAGSLGTDIAGGVFMAAADLSASGTDDLFFGEANGRRAWLVSPDSRRAQTFLPLDASRARGIMGLSISRPRSSLLVFAQFDGGQLVVFGRGGTRLAHDVLRLTASPGGYRARRGKIEGGGDVYEISAGTRQTVLIADASGLHRSDRLVRVDRWVEVPQGERSQAGWVFYESWPR